MIPPRAFPVVVLTLVFLIGIGKGSTSNHTAKVETVLKHETGAFSLIEDKIGEYVRKFTKYLEDFNDRHLGKSALGKFLRYEETKPKLEADTPRRHHSGQSGRMKKMAMAMMPLVFHVGAVSTWMLISAVMSVKSVVIGMALLIFKIAESSAKMVKFFSQWKHEQQDSHGWSTWNPQPHHDYHGSPDWHAYYPEWTPEANYPQNSYRKREAPLPRELPKADQKYFELKLEYLGNGTSDKNKYLPSICV